ncbi:hypothetical protein OK074_2225 [Actinobacteria bacterium OK074]|nr:hypothetical protein OK074_2225 [Actinobacteria bacterium OK074]
MQTAVLTDRERAAVQAYLRLLQTVRATYDDPLGKPPVGDPAKEPAGYPPAVPAAVLAEADRALATAAFAGNEERFFRLVGAWLPGG